MAISLSEYEQTALENIYHWKRARAVKPEGLMYRINQSLHDASDLIRKVPGVDWTIDNVVSGLLQLTNEIAHDTVWREAIYKEYRTANLSVYASEDIQHLHLKDIDQVLTGLNTKYKALTATQGAAAGLAGLAGIAPDVVGLVTLNMRAAGEYATYCGFDIALPSERLFALQILNAASQPTRSDDETSLVSVHYASYAIARQQTVQTVEQMAVSGAIRGIARTLGTRLTQSKLAQLMPMTGAFIGGSFNAFYTAKVCETAFHIYRERWLFEKYGPDLLTDYPHTQ